MATIRRVLKFVPAALIALLVAAWVVTIGGHFCYMFGSGPHGGFIGCYDRCLRFGQYHDHDRRGFFWYRWPEPSPEALPLDHTPHLTFERYENGDWFLAIPLTLVLTALLPVAVGAFTSFRFRLWHYLAYTGVVAVELAYYLCWQE